MRRPLSPVLAWRKASLTVITLFSFIVVHRLLSFAWWLCRKLLDALRTSEWIALLRTLLLRQDPIIVLSVGVVLPCRDKNLKSVSSLFWLLLNSAVTRRHICENHNPTCKFAPSKTVFCFFTEFFFFLNKWSSISKMLDFLPSTEMKPQCLLKQHNVMVELSVNVFFIIFLKISGQADRVENNFFPTLIGEAASSRWWPPYFDFGFFLLLLEESTASLGWRNKERTTVQTNQHNTFNCWKLLSILTDCLTGVKIPTDPNISEVVLNNLKCI